jgi:hypothetical protein
MVSTDLENRHQLWRQSGDWDYFIYPIASPPTLNNRLDELLAIWDSKRVNGALPAWADFNLMDFEGWWGWICVYDIAPHTASSLHVRLFGSQVAQTVGYDLTNKAIPFIDNADIDARYFTQDDKEFHIELRAPGVGYCTGPVKVSTGSRSTAHILTAPLADDGEVVDRFLKGFMYVSQSDASA